MSDLIQEEEERICSNCGSNSTAFTKEGYPRWYRNECSSGDLLYTCHSCYNAQYYRNNKNNGRWLGTSTTATAAIPALESPSDRDHGKYR